MTIHTETRPSDAPVTAAFYLPQFHAIAENDEWWGEGFTEWTNVRRATAQFEGHSQPVVPTGPFGEYDLTNPDVVDWQTALAGQFDIDAFVYYHYWFAGHRLLERPLDGYRASSSKHKFAICWANENWTRRWDGKDREILIAQEYDDQTPGDVFRSFLPYLQDERYLRVNDKSVLLVHRVDHLPNPQAFADTWREMAQAEGIGELWLVASETSYGLEPSTVGFDAVAEFPPVGDSTFRTALGRGPAGLNGDFRGRLNSYDALGSWYMNRPEPEFPRHPCVVPRWDNTPRRGERATIFVGSSPSKYAAWLGESRERERLSRGSSGLVLVNAWNEWAEGAYLEPDEEWGNAYLEASRWGADIPQTGEGPTFAGRINARGRILGAASTIRHWRRR